MKGRELFYSYRSSSRALQNKKGKKAHQSLLPILEGISRETGVEEDWRRRRREEDEDYY